MASPPRKNPLDILHGFPVPAEWEDTTSSDYDNVCYLLFEVNVGDPEYASEVNAFVNGEPRLEVNRIQRVQNPFLLGRFLLRKEQRINFRKENLIVFKYYHPLQSRNLEVALKYNMDIRKYTGREKGQTCDREQNPMFYKTPAQAFNSISSCEIILVCNVLGSIFEGSTTYKEMDAEYMPTYVVRITRK